MTVFELFVLSIGLAMDAFAVSICKGLSMRKMKWKNALLVGTYFGIFQAIMPLIGYMISVNFQREINAFDHWIAFILLVFIGIKMIKDVFDVENKNVNNDFSFKTMTVLSIATSIDALAIGITLAFLNAPIISAVCMIGIITFIISIIGVKIGNIFGDKYEKKAQLVGGIILILIGCKILLSHIF